MTSIRHHDGRQPHETRPPQISFDGLPRVDGSARFSFGSEGPGALSSVSGPTEVRLAVENASQATFEVLVRPLANIPATEAKALGATVRALLTPSLILWQNPRTLVQVVSQALSSGSGDGLVAAIINSSTLALLIVGSVPMRGVVCAISVGRRRVDGALLVDPDEKIEVLDAHGCFAFLFSGRKHGESSGPQGKCVWTNWTAAARNGRGFDEGKLMNATKLAQKVAEEIYNAMFQSIAEVGRGISEKGILVTEKATNTIRDDDDDRMEI